MRQPSERKSFYRSPPGSVPLTRDAHGWMSPYSRARTDHTGSWLPRPRQISRRSRAKRRISCREFLENKGASIRDHIFRKGWIGLGGPLAGRSRGQRRSCENLSLFSVSTPYTAQRKSTNFLLRNLQRSRNTKACGLVYREMFYPAQLRHI